MPQLDTNTFLPIILCLCLCYMVVFLITYMFLSLPLVNWTKIRALWCQKQILSVYFFYIYIKEISSYPYSAKILNILQSRDFTSLKRVDIKRLTMIRLSKPVAFLEEVEKQKNTGDDGPKLNASDHLFNITCIKIHTHIYTHQCVYVFT